jgi:hypothetical protein
MGSRIASPLQDCDHQLDLRRLSQGRINDQDNGKSGLKRNGWKRKLLRMPRARREAARKSSLKRSPLKRESKGRKAELAKYRKLSANFLAQPENFWCICCTLRREKLGENICRNYSTEIHHFALRNGRLLCYVPYFRAFCFGCRDWPHLHPKVARSIGLLAPPNLCGIFPKEGLHNGNSSRQ